jgi:hypothetical protein
MLWNLWLNYARSVFLKEVSWKILEIKVPRDIAKSPRAMEAVFSSLYSASAGSWWKRVSKGFLLHWYSFEIASINGQIHFFVYIQEPFKNLFESQVYAQYPV